MENSVCIERLPHSCGTTKGLQVFLNKDEEKGEYITAYCYNCSTYFSHHPLDKDITAKDIPESKKLGKTSEEVQKEIEDIGSYPVIDLPERRLRASSLDYLGVRIGMSEEDGKTPIFHYYPYTKDGEIVGYKVRYVPDKRIWSIGNVRDVDLFGWEQAKKSGSKRLIITEGELDAVAVHRILEIYSKDGYDLPGVVSLAHGASAAAKDLAKHKQEIRKYFSDIRLCFDDDEAGARAVEEVCKIWPEVEVISLPDKDANECLINGTGKAAFAAITFNAEKKKNTRLVYGSDLHDIARQPAKYGELSWPWEHIQETTRGIRYGETIYVGAGVKMGKSEFLNALGSHFIKEHSIKVFMAKPEEANNKTYKLLAGKIAGKVFHDPKVTFDYDAYDKAGEVIGDKLAMVNLYQHLGWETLKDDIYSAHNWGAKVVFIDPITNLTNGMESSAANVALQGYAQDLSAMAKDLDLVMFIFCHLKAPSQGDPHELGGAVLSSQFAGSRAMMRSCNLMLGLEGNKDPDLEPTERNMRDLILLEDREFGQTGRFGLYWDSKTGLFNEV